MAPTKEQEEFVKLTLKKAMSKDEEVKPHNIVPFDGEVENITKTLHAQYADKKK